MGKRRSRGESSEPGLESFLREIVAAGTVSAATALVADRRGRRAQAAAGERGAGDGEPVAVDDLFDLASLTKPFLATLALRLDAGGVLALDAAIGDLLPEARLELARRTCEDLLRHRAGLVPWYPLWTLFESRHEGPARRGAAVGGLPARPLAQAQRRDEPPAPPPSSPRPPFDWSRSERAPRPGLGRGWEREWCSHRRRDRRGAAGEAGDDASHRHDPLPWLAMQAPLGAEPGTYSDLGYLLWARLAERAAGEALFELLDRELFELLDLGAEDAAQPPCGTPHAVGCALDSARESELAARLGLDLTGREAKPPGPWRGVAQDGNARFLGGVPGHAGLFGSTRALERLGRAWLAPGRLFDVRAAARALGGPPGPYALGWARPSAGGSAGPALAAAAFGHTGFTGGSLWIDPERDRILVLLAHRRDSRADFNPHRRAFHELALSL